MKKYVSGFANAEPLTYFCKILKTGFKSLF